MVQFLCIGNAQKSASEAGVNASMRRDGLFDTEIVRMTFVRNIYYMSLVSFPTKCITLYVHYLITLFTRLSPTLVRTCSNACCSKVHSYSNIYLIPSLSFQAKVLLHTLFIYIIYMSFTYILTWLTPHILPLGQSSI
jgi:hypothetical protein